MFRRKKTAPDLPELVHPDLHLVAPLHRSVPDELDIGWKVELEGSIRKHPIDDRVLEKDDRMVPVVLVKHGALSAGMERIPNRSAEAC